MLRVEMFHRQHEQDQLGQQQLYSQHAHYQADLQKHAKQAWDEISNNLSLSS